MPRKQSKYAAKGGAYRYSALYYEWEAAARDGRAGDARRLGEQHSRRWLGRQYDDNARRRP